MPDSVVQIVRRPVRKTSITPQTEPKAPENVSRKLSIGGESNDRLSPPKSTTRSWLPSSTSPTEERRRSLISDSSSSQQAAASPSQVSNKKEVIEVKAVGGFPITKGENLPALPIAKNRPIKTSKDLELERKVMQWIVKIIKEKPESPSQYDRWIQDGSVIAKLMINIVFNSVPIEVVHSNWGCNPVLDRVKTVIHEMRRYGVTEMFEPADLMEQRNIPKVTRSLAQLCKLATADSTNLLQ